MYCHGCFTETDEAATVFGHCQPRSVHLSRTGLSPQLEHELVDLGQT
jgi:hypothetical protein